MRHDYLLFTLLSLIHIAYANVDPINATYFNLYPDSNPLTHFNVTHDYYRQLILSRDLYVFNGQQCIPTSNSSILYWINRHQLPNVIRRFQANHSFIDLRDSYHLYTIISNHVARVFNEMSLPAKELIHYKDYQYHLKKSDTVKSANLLLIDHDSILVGQSVPLLIIDHQTDKRYPFIPIQIHFKPLPYPQSNFVQFVSNRDRRWEVYPNSIYPQYAGNDNDLLYRLRHNLRHSLGLGHVIDRQCIMFPTNIVGLSATCEQETRALHHLLCDPNLSIQHYTDQQRAPVAID